MTVKIAASDRPLQVVSLTWIVGHVHDSPYVSDSTPWTISHISQTLHHIQTFFSWLYFLQYQTRTEFHLHNTFLTRQDWRTCKHVRVHSAWLNVTQTTDRCLGIWRRKFLPCFHKTETCNAQLDQIDVITVCQVCLARPGTYELLYW